MLTGVDTNKIVKAIVNKDLKLTHSNQVQPIFGFGRTSEIIRDAIMSIVMDQ
jgi:hypothetical protein